MGTFFSGPAPKVTHLQLEVIRLREKENKSWAEIATALNLAGKSAEVKKQYARRLYVRAKATIEQRATVEAHIKSANPKRLNPLQRVAQKHIKRQGDLYVAALPPRPEPLPESPPKPRRVFRFPSKDFYEDNTTESVPVTVIERDGKFFDDQNREVRPVDVVRSIRGWRFKGDHGFWVDMYTRQTILGEK